jgi:pimeloyl-ACP methyl ester carboxylesterase
MNRRAAVAIAVAASAAPLISVPAARATRLRACSDARGALCGTVVVPVDRADPGLGTIPIFVRVVHHTGSGPAREPIVTTEGGPGYAVNENNWQQYRDFVFGPLRARHDLVFIDQRGAGRSQAIDCPSLQKGVDGDVFAAYSACASFLGPAANDYGSGDVALDIDAVRAALGIDRFEFYGGSYAAVDVQAYAARFGEHLAAVVLDSPSRIVGFDDFFRSGPPAITRAVTLVCRRSASCSAEHRAAGDELGWLARRLRAHPLVGTGIDSTGTRHHLRVTESFLAWRIMQNTGGPFVVDAEIAAAAKALRASDEVPLLRLAADSDGPLIGPFTGNTSGAPSEFSGGDNAARQCTDLTLPWQKDAPVPVRRQQFDAARMALAPDSFAPSSIDAWLAPAPTGPIGPDLCLTWPAPPSDVPAPIPTGAQFPSIPALVLSGDLDSVSVPSADARDVAKLFPRSTFVELADSGHHTVFSWRSDCSAKLVQRFLSTHSTGNTSCARSTAFLFPAVGRFPVKAAGAREATVNSRTSDRSTPLDRKIAAVAADALKDTLSHALLTSSDGIGLRGGSYRTRFTNTGLQLQLHAVRFTRDVAITGRAALPFKSSVVTARLTVAGPLAEMGQLTVRGAWLTAGVHTLTITGTLNGHKLALAIPAT